MFVAVSLFFSAIFALFVALLAKSDLFAREAVIQRRGAALLGFGWLRARRKISQVIAAFAVATVLIAYAIAEIYYDGFFLFPAAILPVVLVSNFVANLIIARRTETVKLPEFPIGHLKGCGCLECRPIYFQREEIMRWPPRIDKDAWWKSQLRQTAEDYLIDADTKQTDVEMAGLREKWNLACLRNGLQALDRDGVVKPLPIKHADAKSITIAQLGFTPQEIVQQLTRLSASVGLNLFDVESIGDGLLKIHCAASEIPSKVMLGDIPDCGDKIVLGIGLEGWIAERVEDWPHMLVIGVTGGGKSVTLMNIILQFINNNPTAPVVICDFKSKADFAPFTAWPQVHRCRDSDKMFALLTAVEQERIAREEGHSDARLPLLVVIDEFDMAIDKESRPLFERLITKGRSANIHGIASSQNGTLAASMLTSKMRGNCDVRICHRVNERSDAEKIISEERASMVMNLPRIKGRTVLRYNGGILEMQVPLVNAAMINSALTALPQVQPNIFIKSLKRI